MRFVSDYDFKGRLSLSLYRKIRIYFVPPTIHNLASLEHPIIACPLYLSWTMGVALSLDGKQ